MRNIPLTPVHVVSTPAVNSSALSWPAVPIPAELRQWQEDPAAKVMADAIKLVEDSRPAGGRDRTPTRTPRPRVARAASRARLVGAAPSAPARLPTLRRTTPRRSGDPAAAAPPLCLHPPPLLDRAAGHRPARHRPGGLDDVVRAQRHHLRLLCRHGPAAGYDAVLTGFLFCGHLWTNRGDDAGVHREWTRRGEVLIPAGTETTTFSASRLFAAVYPEAVSLAGLIASPTWRHLAAGDADQQRQFTTEVGRRLDRPHRPGEGGDAVAHWMMFDCWRPPSRPDRTFPDTRQHGAIHPPKVGANSRERHNRSAQWFASTRRGGGAILHHRHVRPVLIRDWSPKMDGIAGTIWASQTTSSTWPLRQPRT